MRSIVYDKDPFSVVTVKAYDNTPKMPYYDSWRGLITPINGVYQQAYYNNGIAVGDKIYFQRSASHHSHYNADGHPTVDLFFCYDTADNTLTSKPCMYDGSQFHMSSLWEKDGIIYGFGYPYRYKTADLGDTWQREDMTTPQYDPCPVFKLRSGRIIGTMLARTKYLMITDDNGLTWRTISPFSNYSFVTTMTHGTICELGDCVVLYFNCPFRSGNTDSSKRYVSVSYDDGDTWTEPKLCAGDLQIAGRGIAPGGFGYIGGKWHFIVGNRYEYKKDDSGKAIIGDLRWYVGTAEDVKNGTMLLRKVLAETKAGTSYRNMSSEDTGNSGVTFCNGALYCNWGNLIYNRAVSNQYMSNQGIEMFRIGLAKENDAEPYWDTNYAAKFNELAQAASHQHNYYFYSPEDTNLSQWTWFGYAKSGYVPNAGKIAVPIGDGDFEINCIANGNVDQVGLSALWPRLFAGVEMASGDLHAFGGSGSPKGFDMTSDSGFPAGSLMVSNGDTYITIKRTGNNLAITINGVTMTNPAFGWEKSKASVVQNVAVDSFVINYNATDENMQSWINTNPRDYNMRGLKMLVIDCNPNYPPRPTYTITNNLTNCTTDNAATTITEGQPYSATITGDAYTENLTVTCTMGGVEQTVVGGVIDIAEVTGDIVITATATIQHYIYSEQDSTGIQLPVSPSQVPKITGWLYGRKGVSSGYQPMLPIGSAAATNIGLNIKSNSQCYFYTKSWGGGTGNITIAMPLVYFELDYGTKTLLVRNKSGEEVTKTWTENTKQTTSFYAWLYNNAAMWHRIKIEIGGEVAYDLIASLDDEDVPCLKDVLTGTCYYANNTAVLGLPPQ